MSLKHLVNSPDVFNAFTDYIKTKILLTQRSLEQATDIPDVYRLQGQITALRRLLSLRDEVNHTEK